MPFLKVGQKIAFGRLFKLGGDPVGYITCLRTAKKCDQGILALERRGLSDIGVWLSGYWQSSAYILTTAWHILTVF